MKNLQQMQQIMKQVQQIQEQIQKQLNELAGLSRAEIDAITPDITDLQKYDDLITVVKEASRVNLSQAQLKQQIEKLGEIAVKIAKRIPSLVELFAA